MHSVILPCYNGALYLEECVLSVLSQISDKDELIIIDDCESLPSEYKKAYIYLCQTLFERARKYKFSIAVILHNGNNDKFTKHINQEVKTIVFNPNDRTRGIKYYLNLFYK